MSMTPTLRAHSTPGVGGLTRGQTASTVEASPRNVAHLLRRAAWGGTPEQIDAFTGGSIDGVVRQLLDARNAPDAGSPLRRTQGEAAFEEHEFTLWWWHLAITSQAPAVERLAWFWHGHFATSLQKVEWPDLMHQQLVMLRRLGLGRFDDLLHAVTLDPAMNVWLDLHQSEVGAVNENYARELMELFSMGASNGYTQTDVTQAARALTGYGLRYQDGGWRPTGTQLLPEFHDFGQKTLLGVTGDLSADDVIAAIVATPESARHIASRLWTRYAGTEPDDSVIGDIAMQLANGGTIHAALTTLLTHPAFYSDEVRTGLVTQPVETLVRTFRNFEIPVYNPNGQDLGSDENGEIGIDWEWFTVDWWAEQLGQRPGYPPNVGGWPHNEPWLDANRSSSRVRIGRDIAWRVVEPEGRVFQRLSAPGTPRGIAEAVLRQFGLVEWSPDTLEAVATAADAGDWLSVEFAITAAFVSPEVVLA